MKEELKNIKEEITKEIQDYVEESLENETLTQKQKEEVENLIHGEAEVTLDRYLENREFDKDAEPRISFEDIDNSLDDLLEQSQDREEEPEL